MTQQPDSKPGFYYVSVVRSPGNFRLLRGPFEDDHASALAAVDPSMHRARDLDPKAYFYSYGTVRSDQDLGPGILDRLDAAQSAKGCEGCGDLHYSAADPCPRCQHTVDSYV